MKTQQHNGHSGRRPDRNEELYRLIAEHATDMISRHTPEGFYTYTSPACRALLGYEPEELVGHDAYEFFHPEDLRQIREAHSAILKVPDTSTVAYRIRRKDGSYTWFETTSKTIRDERTGEVKEIIAVSRDISERKRSEEILRYQLELTGAITENAADALFLLNHEGRITFTNSAAARIFGWRQEELLGEVLHDKVHHHRPDRRQYPLSECPLNAVLASGRTLHDHEDVFFRRDGSPVTVACSSAPITIGGQVTGLVVVVHDVSERKQVEDELDKANQRIASILESITEDFYALDTEWRFTYINEGTLSAIRRAKGAGLTREDLLGKNMWEVLPELVGSRFYQKYHEALHEQKTLHVEGYSPLRDAWVEAHAYPSEGGLSVYLQDITERKRAEEQLRESEGRLRRAVEIETVGVIFFRTDGTITDANNAFLGMSGYSREDLMEGLVRWDRMTPPEWMPHSLKAIEEFKSTGRTIPYEKEYIRKDGSRWWALFAATRLDEEEGVEFIIDITRRRQAEESLLEMRKAERRRIARDLHDGVLQDLAGALQGLQAVQLELEGAGHEADLKQETDALRRAVGGLRRAVHDLRDENDRPFVQAIEALVEYNRQLTPDRQIRLSVRENFPKELPEQVKVELIRIVQEALTNARQHSEAEWVGVKLYEQREEEEERVCVQVLDDGRGFDPESVRRGLGLVGMRERIESFGGDLEIRSKVGKGTMVTVTVPTQDFSDDH